MPDSWTGLLSNPVAIAVALGALVIVLLVVRHYYLTPAPTPEELERLRRLAIHRGGKMGDGEIVDVDDNAIVYSYSVAGVVYTASQDATELRAIMPPDPMSMIGPVMIKFDPRNAANSIVLCEEWSGLRTPRKV